MSQKVFVLDTSILCCLLGVPGKETCGPKEDTWDNKRVETVLRGAPGAIWVLPMASIIETGNHIAQATGDRYAVAQRFAEQLRQTAEGSSPWAAFSDQSELWSSEKIGVLADRWPQLAAEGTSMGDATIRDVAEFYAQGSNFDVEILTGDAGLKAYEPGKPAPVPRRRQVYGRG